MTREKLIRFLCSILKVEFPSQEEAILIEEEIKPDYSRELIETLKKDLAYERSEKERYRDMLHKNVGLVDEPTTAPEGGDDVEGDTLGLAGYVPLSTLRSQFEAEHARQARDKKAEHEES